MRMPNYSVAGRETRNISVQATTWSGAENLYERSRRASMELVTFVDPEHFYQCAIPFLLRHEAEYNLFIGIAGELKSHSTSFQGVSPYLAMVEDNAYPVGVALRTPPQNILISRIEPPASAADALNLLIDRLSLEQPDLSGVTASPDIAQLFADLWQQRTGHHL